jgi:hypothetical protein
VLTCVERAVWDTVSLVDRSRDVLVIDRFRRDVALAISSTGVAAQAVCTEKEFRRQGKADGLAVLGCPVVEVRAKLDVGILQLEDHRDPRQV